VAATAVPVGRERQAWPSASASAEEHHEDGFGEDPQIPAQRRVRDVIQVEPDHLVVIQVAPPANLPGACDAGFQLEPLRKALRIQAL
jgi:hypothetical protein